MKISIECDKDIKELHIVFSDDSSSIVSSSQTRETTPSSVEEPVARKNIPPLTSESIPEVKDIVKKEVTSPVSTSLYSTEGREEEVDSDFSGSSL